MNPLPLANNPALVGVDPASTIFANFAFREFVGAGTAISSGVCSFSVPSVLPARKIYGYVYTPGTGTVIAQVNFFLRGSNVGSLPLFSSGGAAALPATLASPLNCGGNVGKDSVVVQPTSLLSGEATTTIIQAFHLRGEIDQVSVDVQQALGTSGYRIVLAVASGQ